MNTRAGMRIGKLITPGLTGIAFVLSSLILKRKGYKIVGQIPFDMPSNWISIHPALSTKAIKFLHRVNYKQVDKHTHKLYASNTFFLAYRNLVQDIIISPIAFAYYFFGKYLFAKSFYASNACNNCGLCEKQCPVKAIKSIDNRPFWTFTCESCMKCMNICPHKAIETAHALLIIVGVLSSTMLSFFLTHILKVSRLPNLLRHAMATLVFFTFLWLFYRFQHVLLKSKFIGKIISYTSLTHYKFWGRYKSIPDNKWKK